MAVGVERAVDDDQPHSTRPSCSTGVLYHESDLNLEEHYTDTHGYTEINFAEEPTLNWPLGY